MTKSEKLALINKRNPEWKELVTEDGFCEKPIPWAEQVKRVMDELISSADKK
jgi:putative endonuclease